MKLKLCLPVLALALALAMLGAAVARADGPPAGEGATACYQLFAGGTFTDATQLVVNAKYNVGNPASVQLAGDCNGGPIGFVDDGLTVNVTNPSQQGGGSLHQDYFDFCGGSNTGGPALDLTSLFKPGTNNLSLTLTNECGGITEATPLYLIVSQH